MNKGKSSLTATYQAELIAKQKKRIMMSLLVMLAVTGMIGYHREVTTVSLMVLFGATGFACGSISKLIQLRDSFK